MAVQSEIVTLTTGPTAIAATGGHGILRVVIRNRSSATVYLGNSGVTTAGFPLSSDDGPLTLRLTPDDALYGASTGSIGVGVIRMNETT